MTDDVLLSKRTSLERCIKQIHTYYNQPSTLPFEEDYMLQDALAMNLQRSCELCIDMANDEVMRRKLGLPKVSRESFLLLARAGIITDEVADSLVRMVGFRNVLVHQYQDLDLDRMLGVIESNLKDLLDFSILLTQEPQA